MTRHQNRRVCKAGQGDIIKILHIDCSSRIGSWSRQLSTIVCDEFKATYPDVTVMRRDLGFDPIPHPCTEYATALSTREAYMAAQGTDAFVISELLIREIEAADVIVLGTPMHNFTVPSCLKAWLDHVMLMGRTIGSGPDGKFGLLADRPVYVAIASGDILSGPGAKQPDHLTPYLGTAFGCIGLSSMFVFAIQNTARTEMNELVDRIDQLRPTISRTICDRPVQAAETA